MNCKHGDLAIVINDYPECVANIGRVVEVRGPSHIDREGLLVWCAPISSEPFLYNTWEDPTPFPMSPDDNDIQHPDAWLLPILSVAEYRKIDEQIELTAPKELELA